MPLDNIHWIDREKLCPNDYNPNHVAKSELKLLKLSILEDGWTQPIVARRDGTIVDGFHRWTISGTKEVSSLTGGQVPVVYIDDSVSEGHQRMSTIRHNRARGSHVILKMSNILQELCAMGLSNEEIGRRLGMENEEIERLLFQGGIMGKILEEKQDFSKAWIPDSDAAIEAQKKKKKGRRPGGTQAGDKS